MEVIQGGFATGDDGVHLAYCNGLDLRDSRRMYIIRATEGMSRGWHGHEHEAKWVFVLYGRAKIATRKLDGSDPQSVTLEGLQAVYIPAGHFNAWKALDKNTAIAFFSDKTLEESKDDDIREDLEKWPL